MKIGAFQLRAGNERGFGTVGVALTDLAGNTKPEDHYASPRNCMGSNGARPPRCGAIRLGVEAWGEVTNRKIVPNLDSIHCHNLILGIVIEHSLYPMRLTRCAWRKSSSGCKLGSLRSTSHNGICLSSSNSAKRRIDLAHRPAKAQPAITDSASW